MTKCPACGKKAFSPIKKAMLPLGRLRACENCGASLGLSSSVVGAYVLPLGAFYLAGKSGSLGTALGWLAVGIAVLFAVLLAWIPLWQVVSVQTREAEYDQRSRSNDETA